MKNSRTARNRRGCGFRFRRGTGTYSGTYVGGQGLNLGMMALCQFSCLAMSPIHLRQHGPEHAFILE